MLEDYFKIEVPAVTGESAFIRCLKFEGKGDLRGLFASWLAKEMRLPVNDEIILKRVDFVLEQREKLSEIEGGGDKAFLLSYLARLLSAKFSGSKQSELATSLVIDKLVYCFKNEKPIVFIFGFGGYKNHNSPSFPEVDWAELFHMKYMVTYLWPIISTYKYGVEFEYESEEISIQFNNVPQETTDRYTKTFKSLLNYFCDKIYQMNGVKLDFKQVIARDMYEPKALYERMKFYHEDMKKVYFDLPAEEKEVWFKRAKTNFLIKGTQDFSNLSEEELKNIIVEARVTNECFLAADYDLRIDFWERPNAISLFGTWGKTPCASPTDGGLHLKSTSASNTDFWIGTGVFKLGQDKKILQEMILSHNQYEDVKDKILTMENEDKDLAKISINFEKIKYIL